MSYQERDTIYLSRKTTTNTVGGFPGVQWVGRAPKSDFVLTIVCNTSNYLSSIGPSPENSDIHCTVRNDSHFSGDNGAERR